ncbi:hypothetical protein ACGFIV_31320 [Sphaerisporangium sp. NPDC049003]|uniref:hypothetical protein n=1 Tax=Sphaerisporangium sp. NPDC049003 TaxID=3364517 RepID=UPI00371E1549
MTRPPSGCEITPSGTGRARSSPRRVLAQYMHPALASPDVLERLPGATFDGSAHIAADADLIVDGLLLEFKNTRRIHQFPLPMILQLLGYTLMDYSDRYRIDRVGVYMTRVGALIPWPIEDYLALLGACRRDLAELRAAFEKLLAIPDAGPTTTPLPDQLPAVDDLLAELTPVIPEGCCRVCAQPLTRPVISPTRPRLSCSPFCGRRAPSLRYHG